VCKADNLPPSCVAVTKSGNHNFLEPSGPVQDCNGIGLPLHHENIISKILQLHYEDVRDLSVIQFRHCLRTLSLGGCELQNLYVVYTGQEIFLYSHSAETTKRAIQTSVV